MNQQLSDLGDRFWDLAMSNSPMWASIIGDHRFDAEVENLSAEHEAETAAQFEQIVADAEALDPAALDAEDRVSRRVLMFEAEGVASSLRARSTEYLVDPMLGLHMDIVQGISQLKALNNDHASAFLEKASKVGTQFDQAMERHREGVANGRTPPTKSVEKVMAQLDAMLAQSVADNGFLQIGLPEDWSADQENRWREAMAAQVTDVVMPALAAYREMVENEVLPAGRPEDKSGLCWLPDGDEVYARAVKRYTSLDATPDEIHQIGLDEIASLENEYRELGGNVLGTTDVPEIYDRLRNDTALRFETAEQVQQAAESALARANAATPEWFGRLPEAPCIVQPIPGVGAEDATLAYYLPPSEDGARPGIYFLNLTQPETRTRYEAEALAFHESVPGHHLQLTIAQELEELPQFRKHGIVTVYVEGWGLYTERLSDEMGLYSGDLERMGMLSFDSWRAVRLVVDTGMHAKGWSRQQAIDYFIENSPQAPNNIVNEVDRYIGYAGQALAYKMGQRELFKLRAEAQQTMGDRFDIKGYHDTVLGSGPVPLDLLGDLVREWAAG